MRSGLHQKRRRPAHARARPAHARARAAPSRRVRRLIGIVLAMALLATGIWLGPDLASFRKSATAAPGIFNRPTVAVVGDSITALSRESIATSLAQAGYQPSIEAANSIELVKAVPLVDQLAEQKPNDWIIELGTNDAGRDNPLWALPILADWQRGPLFWVRDLSLGFATRRADRSPDQRFPRGTGPRPCQRSHLGLGQSRVREPHVDRTGHDPSHPPDKPSSLPSRLRCSAVTAEGPRCPSSPNCPMPKSWTYLHER